MRATSTTPTRSSGARARPRRRDEARMLSSSRRNGRLTWRVGVRSLRTVQQRPNDAVGANGVDASGDLGVATDVAAEPDESDGAGRAVRVWTWNASERPASLQRRRRHLADPPLPSVAATRESAMASEPQLAVGEHLGAYRIEMLVARGGMGEVYRALDRRLGRPVALKVLVREIADQPLFRERFLRESRLAASLDHPNVLPIYEAGEF